MYITLHVAIVNEILSSQQVCHYRVRMFEQQEIEHGINNRTKVIKMIKKGSCFTQLSIIKKNSGIKIFTVTLLKMSQSKAKHVLCYVTDSLAHVS